MTMRRARRQMSASAERSGAGQGEALTDPGSDEAMRPRHEVKSMGPGLLGAARFLHEL
jgi:RNA-directed DNA polymerase